MMSFPDAVKTCFQKYVTFSGRAPRAEYWYFTLFYFLISIVAGIIDAVIFGTSIDGTGILGVIVSLGLFLPGLAVLWRRLHDTNKPGWYALVWFVAYLAAAMLIIVSVVIGVIGILAALGVMIYWLVQPSSPGPNDFGPNPYDDPGKSLEEVFE